MPDDLPLRMQTCLVLEYFSRLRRVESRIFTGLFASAKYRYVFKKVNLTRF